VRGKIGRASVRKRLEHQQSNRSDDMNRTATIIAGTYCCRSDAGNGATDRLADDRYTCSIRSP